MAVVVMREPKTRSSQLHNCFGPRQLDWAGLSEGFTALGCLGYKKQREIRGVDFKVV